MASQPQLQMNGWLSVPWAHYTGRGAGSDGTDGALGHGPSGNQFVFPIQVKHADVAQAIQELCGIYQFDPNTKFLNRTLPKQCPAYGMQHLYVNRVTSIKPMHWTGKELVSVGSGLGRFSGYDYVILTILFTQPHWPILSDGYLDFHFPPVVIGGQAYRREWLRYMERIPTVAGDIFTIESGTMKFSETSGTGPPADTALNVPVGQPLTVGDFALVWRQVPHYGLFSPATFRPENLIAAANKVNAAEFLGYPAETLLFAGASFAWNETPYPASALAQAVLQTAPSSPEQPFPSLTVDVTLVFKFKDPPPGSTSRGWNLQPWYGRKTPTVIATDFKWYRATSDGAAGSPPMLGTADFEKLFAMST
jgi:hypothetical protein